ncbi:MAG TPA: S41 family peptidase [Gemmatimonadaceae bacterium]|nr:S41 family peptidase [Gemmatimonadaceae bacterium]
MSAPLRAVALGVVALGVATAAAAPLAAQAPATTAAAATPATRPRTTYEDLQLLSGVLNQIRVNHPDTVDVHELLMAAIDGMVKAADPHSYFMPAVRLNPEKEKAMRAGKLAPVGVGFGFYDASPVVTSVAPGSAASKADVLIGDELIAIAGQPVSATNEFELEMTLAGAPGSSVVVTLERERVDGSLVQLERTLKRERLDGATAVPAAFMLDAASGTGYVRITSFMNDKVADDLHDALGRLEKAGMKRLVLDLRDNGGGSVSEAAHVAGEFLPKDAVVYTSEGRKKEVADTGRVGRSFWSHERRYPIVLMINSGSASASELVAGALQDHDRALIVGRPSFGKSLLMTGLPMPDGSLFEMVIGHMKTPCGRVIQRQYRGLTTHEYHRRAGLVDSTGAGRPSCRTDGGRTVYGGGGIYPDVLLPKPARAPLWLARVRENGLFLKWIGGHVTAAGPAAYPSLDALAAAPVPAPGAVAAFRQFATAQGVDVPTDSAADATLGREIVRLVADAKWGDAGYYRIVAAQDADVTAAVAAFGKAGEILKN